MCVFAITFQQIHTNTCQKIPGNTSQQIHTTTLQKNDPNMSLQILFNKTIQTQSKKSTCIHRGEHILISSPTIHENIFRESYRNTRKLNTLYILGQSWPRMGSSDQDSLWAGTFCCFLNFALRESGAQLGKDISIAGLRISKNVARTFSSFTGGSN